MAWGLLSGCAMRRVHSIVSAVIAISLAGCTVMTRFTGPRLGAGSAATGNTPAGTGADPAGAPDPGDREAAPARGVPTWCDAPGINAVSLSNLSELYTETEPHRALYTIVAASCAPDNEARQQARQIEATRLAWSKKLRLTDADWRDVAVFATAPLQARINGALSRPAEHLAYSAYSPLDQYELLMRAQDPTRLADIFGARLSQAGRLAYVTRCLTEVPLVWAMCQADIDGFDADKLAIELRADTHGGFDRIRARIEAYLIGPQLVAHAGEVKALVAKDPGYAQLFALATAARRDWAKVDPALIALANAMDDAAATSSRKASAGCHDRTWRAWAALVAAIPAKQFTGFPRGTGLWFEDQAMMKITRTPDGYLASLALAACGELTEESDYLRRSLGSALSALPGFRGPRSATHTAILAANITLDDRSARIEAPRLDRSWQPGGGGSSGNVGGTGTILSLAPAGDTVEITFAKVKGMQSRCVRGKTTNRVVQIRDDGTLVYEYICLEERMEAYAEPPAPPQRVDARYAAGLEPGMFVTIVDGVVTVAYRKGSATPAFVFGVPVK